MRVTVRLNSLESYHAFPKDVKVSEEWKKFCLFIEEHIEETLHSSSTHYLCSSHFVAKDYLHPVGGLRNKLRTDAIPSVYCSTTKKRDHTKIKDGAINVHYTSKQFKTDHTMGLDHLAEKCTSISSVATPDTPINELHNVLAQNSDKIPHMTQPLRTYSLEDNVSSNDSAIFNFESNMIANESTSAEPACKYPFFKEPRYIGDNKSPHLATPRRAKRAIALVKMTITKQRSKIWNLKRTTRRLKKRITTLKGLVKRLKGKN